MGLSESPGYTDIEIERIKSGETRHPHGEDPDERNGYSTEEIRRIRADVCSLLEEDGDTNTEPSQKPCDTYDQSLSHEYMEE